jgi:hypothetical protein
MRTIVLSVVSGLIVVAISALLKYIGRKIRAVRESRVTDVKITYNQITSGKTYVWFQNTGEAPLLNIRITHEYDKEHGLVRLKQNREEYSLLEPGQTIKVVLLFTFQSRKTATVFIHWTDQQGKDHSRKEEINQ